MLDGKLAIEYKPEVDEVLVEIREKTRERIVTGGSRGNRFEFTIIAYSGKVIANLTNPDREIQYE